MKNDRGQAAHLILTLDLGAGAHNDELDQAARRLRAELMDLDFDSVELLKEGDLPAGAKSAEALTLGSLGVVLLPSLLPKLLEYLQSWSLRGENRKVSIKTRVGDRSIELDYNPSVMSSAELEQLIKTLTGALSTQPNADTGP
jgi:hypothetical protein